MDLKNFESLICFYPEAILTGTILLLVLLDLVLRRKEILGYIAGVGCLLSLYAAVELFGARGGWLFQHMIILDNFSIFFKVLFLLATLLVICMSLDCHELQRVHKGEYYTILFTSTLGMCFMASSSNLLMAYLSLELVSLTSYILTGSLPHNRPSTEAALKYLMYWGVFSVA